MNSVWIYSLGSVFLVSLISFVGVLALSVKTQTLRKFLLYFISFSAGALFGDAFLHLLPEAVSKSGFTIQVSSYILSGIVAFFVIEKFVHWRHCHLPEDKDHKHPFAYMNLFGDAVHNFIDGLIIGAAYLIDIRVGMATTVAVLLHEIPQEIGDFGVLLHGGFSKGKALFLNFLISLSALLGVTITLFIGTFNASVTDFLVPFAAGGFIYIAGSDLIPELHKDEFNFAKALGQLFAFVFGIVVMYLLVLGEGL